MGAERIFRLAKEIEDAREDAGDQGEESGWEDGAAEPGEEGQEGGLIDGADRACWPNAYSWGSLDNELTVRRVKTKDGHGLSVEVRYEKGVAAIVLTAGMAEALVVVITQMMARD